MSGIKKNFPIISALVIFLIVSANPLTAGGGGPKIYCGTKPSVTIASLKIAVYINPGNNYAKDFLHEYFHNASPGENLAQCTQRESRDAEAIISRAGGRTATFKRALLRYYPDLLRMGAYTQVSLIRNYVKWKLR